MGILVQRRGGSGRHPALYHRLELLLFRSAPIMIFTNERHLEESRCECVCEVMQGRLVLIRLRSGAQGNWLKDRESVSCSAPSSNGVWTIDVPCVLQYFPLVPNDGR